MRISIIIPTLNRPNELARLLDSISKQTRMPDEVFVVDQSTEARKHRSTKAQKHESTSQCGAREHMQQSAQVLKCSSAFTWYFVDFQSLTKARNFGVKKASGDIIGFLDDDCILDKEYIKNIEQFFETHPHALGVQGIITDFEQGHAKKVGGKMFVYRCYNLFAKIFLLNNSSTKNKLLLSGRNQYASRVASIQPCEWLSGIGNYRKKVFQEFSFDEHLDGYALGEDKLFSYPIFQKYGDVLCVDPSIRCEHKHAEDGRPKGKEWVDMKIRYTYYLWRKLLKNKGIVADFGYIWANIGDLLVVLFSVFAGQHPFRFFWWHVVGYVKVMQSNAE